jgi:hypothetical protein
MLDGAEVNPYMSMTDRRCEHEQESKREDNKRQITRGVEKMKMKEKEREHEEESL